MPLKLRSRTEPAAAHDVDVVIVGGGLSGGLLALKLADARPELKTLVLEAGATLGGVHTWSFFESDVASPSLAWLKPLIAHRWPGYDVRFPKRRRSLRTPYFSITAERFHATLMKRMRETVVFNVEAAEVRANLVTLTDGRSVSASAVIDARGPAPSVHIDLGFQKFLGLEVETERSHGLTQPIIMDATVPQIDGYRFLYALPFGPKRLLLEDTRYADGPELDAGALRASTLAYAAGQGWTVTETIREEQGVLPIALGGDIYAFWSEAERQTGAARIGLGAVLFHPTTGYSLPDAVRTAERLAKLPHLNTGSVRAEMRVASIEAWRERAFFRALNRMLFRAGDPDKRYQVLQRHYGMSEGLIRRFYAGDLTLADKARILAGKPPVPIGAALRALPQRPLLAKALAAT